MRTNPCRPIARERTSEVEGQKFPLPYVVRAAYHKTAWEIHQEIRAFQKLHSAEVPSMPPWLARGFARWPGVMVRLFGWMAGRSSLLWKRSVGTSGITAVGMFGKGLGWGIPYPTPHSLFLTLDGISEKPGVVEEHITTQEYLQLTVCFDHDIIDGAPAARFTERLKELIESGYGLIDQEASSALNESKPQPQEV
jgi:2-oxoacid dehydrogenase/acyltransferase catalytic subunit